jgi:hypothetical protein
MCVAVKYARAVKACALKTQPLLNSSETCHYQGNPRPVRHWCGGHSQTQHTKKQQPAHHTLTSIQLLLSSAHTTAFAGLLFLLVLRSLGSRPPYTIILTFAVCAFSLYIEEDVLQPAVYIVRIFSMYLFCAMQPMCACVCFARI